MSEIKLAIKVDADTWLGTREGLPRLRDIFAERNIKASFFLSLGPDNSGRAIWRIIGRPGFLAKMVRTRAPAVYGLRTLFMGTLLRAPIISQGQGPLVRELMRQDHEIGLHAWDHVKWQDALWRMSDQEVRVELARARQAFADLTGEPPLSFAAPAWRISVAALRVLEASDLVYMSGTRGATPYWPSIWGHCFHLLEIPTTLPTADELLGRNGIGPDNIVDYYLQRIASPGLHVLTVHAEMEGRSLARAFGRLLDGCLARGVMFVRLIDIAREALKEAPRIPTAEVVRRYIPGRSGKVSQQGPPCSPSIH